LPEYLNDEHISPLLCAGLIGYRALRRATVPEKGRLLQRMETPDALLSTRAAPSLEFTSHEFLWKRGPLHELTSRRSALPVKKDS
jgi:hypothetical protein